MTLESVDTLGAVPRLALGRGSTWRNWPLWNSNYPMVCDREGFFPRMDTWSVFPLFSLSRLGHIAVNITYRSIGVQFRCTPPNSLFAWLKKGMNFCFP